MNISEQIQQKQNKEKINKYCHSKIYKLIDNVNQYFYIGSTISALSKRFYEHKSSANSHDKNRKVYMYMNDVGWENVQIVLVSEHILESREQLLREERKEQDKYINDSKCLNSLKSYRSKDERREYDRNFDRTNVKRLNRYKTEQYHEYYTKYREKNIERIKENVKRYYEAHKQKIKCDCGTECSKNGRVRHERSKRHQNCLKSHQQDENKE